MSMRSTLSFLAICPIPNLIACDTPKCHDESPCHESPDTGAEMMEELDENRTVRADDLEWAIDWDNPRPIEQVVQFDDEDADTGEAPRAERDWETTRDIEDVNEIDWDVYDRDQDQD